ncbi:MAG TPA: DUF4157 domain-containing protein [Thermoanaerobaculia bacterium]|nr:DUF4157 domain-containing protein [Thermoanaerobaculia bacterium]
MAFVRTALPQPPAPAPTAASAPAFGVSGAFRIQPKLQIGPPGDRHEREAERVATQVVNVLRAPAVPQPAKPKQRKAAGISSLQPPSGKLLQGCDACGGTGGSEPELEHTLRRARESGGESFSQAVRQPMERAFGADFSGVTIHRDRESDQLNQAIHARAFTTGQDVFFRRGEYSPASRSGQELLAHELTHVVQQGGSEVRRAPAEPESNDGEPSVEIDDTAPEGAVQRACTRNECDADYPLPLPARKRRRRGGGGDGGGGGAFKRVKRPVPEAQPEAQPEAHQHQEDEEMEEIKIPIATRLENGRHSVPTLQRRAVGGGPAVGSGALFLNVAAVPGRGDTLVQRAGIVTGPPLNTGAAAFTKALAGAPPVAGPAYGALTHPYKTATQMNVQGLHQQILGTGVNGKRPLEWKAHFQRVAGSNFCQGHFLSQKLSGKGEHQNLAPFTRSLNGLHSAHVEQPIIDWTRAGGNNEWADYEVKANYLGNPGISAWAKNKYGGKSVATRVNETNLLPGVAGAGGPFTAATVAAADLFAEAWLDAYVNAAFPSSIDCEVTFIKDTTGAGNFAATAPQKINITNDL